VVQPKRWVVERTIGWMNNFRALSKDYDTDAKGVVFYPTMKYDKGCATSLIVQNDTFFAK
jgi:transposase